MALIEPRRKPDAIVTTNTSGIPINQIAQGRSPEFKAHFLGTHFFNPPRYMRLLEIILTAETDPEVVRVMTTFAAETLGKGVVQCKDTPNFIANRLGSFAGMNSLRYIFDQGFTVEEVDALTGTLIGRPKTATFRLLDLAGIDIAAGVARNLQQAVPDDESRDALAVSPLLEWDSPPTLPVPSTSSWSGWSRIGPGSPPFVSSRSATATSICAMP
jgi:3-hydroxyacyl-CoA dehydrogenase